MICETCSNRFKNALSFKSACLSNRDGAKAAVNILEMKVERTEENTCSESNSVLVDEERCFLCMQLVTEQAVWLSGVDEANSVREMIEKYIPELVSE